MFASLTAGSGGSIGISGLGNGMSQWFLIFGALIITVILVGSIYELGKAVHDRHVHQRRPVHR
ncbi:hypothetical protein [Cellulosimicrobium protaetiae]|uniref:Uncharacterized protein n=1 Tax=Cellulosimicrobium protaetiae TaxID=2587808 RepID=A0A6M5UBE7_9MICO|nr:hypothetical protein [Cellulosimicrobium protaetiae]QJW34832.1 hypothetical protein FIC82_000065 [Cellulosimicrobium protaetiae]